MNKTAYFAGGCFWCITPIFKIYGAKEVISGYSGGTEAKSGKQVQIAVEPFKSFYAAEEYHQDYYLKNPEDFEKELRESGRK